LNGCGWNRDIQSIAFLSGAPTDQLYSGEAKSSASAARISVVGPGSKVKLPDYS